MRVRASTDLAPGVSSVPRVDSNSAYAYKGVSCNIDIVDLELILPFMIRMYYPRPSPR